MKSAVGNKLVHVPLEAKDWPIDDGWWRLDDLCEGVFDCPHSTQTISESGPYVVRSQDMRSGVFRLSEAAHVSEKVYLERIARAEPRFGDVLYSREGTYFGIAAEVPQNVRVCLGQRMVLIRPNPKKLNARFLRYWLNSPIMSRHNEGFRDGTVAERLNMPVIRGLPIPLFELPVQEGIALILGALDDKIDLNGRMNKTLEAMARAIFKDWFVDFGPTRAKMEGRAPYLAPETWALFPDRFDAEDKPDGWERLSLREAAEVLSGGTPDKSKPEYWGGSIPWISPKVMNEMHVANSDEMITPLAIGNGTRMASSGSVLLMVRGMGLHQGVRISQARRDVSFNQDVKALIPRRVAPAHLLFGLLDAAPFLFAKVEASGHGTGKLPTDIIETLDFVLPKGTAYVDLVRPLDAINEKIALNNQESATLAEMRDLLLPKLMSGEIRVRDAEKKAEAAQ